MEDIKIKRKMMYNERKKILTISAEVEQPKEKKLKIETIDYFGEASIKSVADNFKNRKEYFKSQIETHEKETSTIKDQIKALKKKGINLTDEEKKIKDALEKINNTVNYENLLEKMKSSKEMITFARKDLKDTNAGFEELKQKVKNIKL